MWRLCVWKEPQRMEGPPGVRTLEEWIGGADRGEDVGSCISSPETGSTDTVLNRSGEAPYGGRELEAAARLSVREHGRENSRKAAGSL